MGSGQPPRPVPPRPRFTPSPSGRPPPTDAAGAAPNEAPPAGGGPGARIGPPWLATVEEVLTRAVVAGLVALVVVQSLMAGRGPLAYETYGRVLEDWGYRPGMPAAAWRDATPAGVPTGSSATPGATMPGASPPTEAPRSPGVLGAAEERGASRPAPAGATADRANPTASRTPSAQALLTFGNRGPSSVAVVLNGVELARLVPGDRRPVVVRPGDRLALRAEAGGAEVVLTHASGPLAAPTPGSTWRVGPQGTAVRLAWRAP